MNLYQTVIQLSISKVLNNGIKIQRTHSLHHIKQPTVSIRHPYPQQYTQMWNYGNYYYLITYRTEKCTNEHHGKLLHSILSST